MGPGLQPLAEAINYPWASQLLYSALFQCSAFKQLHIFSSFSPTLYNPCLQPSLFFTTNPSYIRLPKLVFQLDSLLCAQTVGVEGWASAAPYSADGHPRNASSPWVWAAANHVASQCHWGAETTETEHFLCSQKQKTAFCSDIGSKCWACLIRWYVDSFFCFL